MTDVSKAVQYALQEHPPIRDLVTQGVIGKDAAWVNGWVFDSSLRVVLENTQKCAIVVSYGGPWETPDPSNTFRSPSVAVDIWADPTRNPDNSVKFDDAKTKCFDIYDAVFSLLHRTNRDTASGGSLFFDSLRVLASQSLGEPDLTSVSDGNGAKMLRARFGLTI